MARNPNWTRDELILALDLFFRAGRIQLDASHAEVIQLSHLLNQLPIHGAETRKADFRNPQGVSMKLGNFLALDPTYPGMGLQRGGKLDQDVWNEFAHDRERLHGTAAAITKNIHDNAERLVAYCSEPDEDEEEFPEGKLLTRLHKRKERSRKATARKKQHVLRKTGRLACEACDFDFVRVYGQQLGEGFAECHHTVPIADLTANHPTRLTDLAILCANCHRMIHKSRPILSVQELRTIIEDRRK